MTKQYTLIILLVVIGIHELDAQSFYAWKRDRRLTVMAGAGTSTYFGELANPGKIMDGTPNVSIGTQYKVGERLRIRGELMWYNIKGDDSKAPVETGRLERNLSFRANNFEFNISGVVYALPIHNRYYIRPVINGYAFVGIGVSTNTPTANYQGEWYFLRKLQTENVSYSPVIPVVPFGAGISIFVSNTLNVNLEGGYRIVFTDYLDDVSTVHQDPSSFDNPLSLALSDRRYELGLPPAQAGKVRGNPDKNDGYFIANIKLEYYLPNDFFGRSRLRRAKGLH